MSSNNNKDPATRPFELVTNTISAEACQICGDKPNVMNHGARIDVLNDLHNLVRKPQRGDLETQFQRGTPVMQTNYVPPYLCERSLPAVSGSPGESQ